jgi:hypothetical protein
MDDSSDKLSLPCRDRKGCPDVGMCPDCPGRDDLVSSEMPAGGIGCFCPKCGADLREGSIRPESYHLYGYGGAKQPVICRYGCGDPPHFSRLTGIYDIGRDRTAAWHCPDCNETWPR